MEENRNMSCQKARELDLVDYLERLGISPVKIRGVNFWYHSPFREERTPSFKINRKLNRWYDFGEGSGGNIIDFAVRYNNFTVGEFLKSISDTDAIMANPLKAKTKKIWTEKESKIKIINDKALFAYPLLNYLKERRIPIYIYNEYCREVNFMINERPNYAIGFRNNAGGWELRNKYFKGSSSPKEITTIVKGFDTLAVFEGFMDFLSFLTVISDSPYDYLILNSLPLFERAKKNMERYRNIHLFLDNDVPGKNYTQYALGLDEKYQDKSQLYRNYKDLNDWLMNQKAAGRNP